MKNTIKLFITIVGIMTCLSMSAQSVGIRLEDDWFLGSYKMHVKDNITGEAFAGIETLSFIDLFKAGIELDINTPMPSIEELNWFYGGGGGLVFGDLNWIELFGSIGLDYTFSDIPLNLSLAALPTIRIGDNFGDNFDVNFALGARYVLNND